ncbi:MAG: hypothetical protein LUF92_00245, partial [Clostridiales bacterium]|nr:hypothetical protein [Clostridiales bacterium]
MKVMAKRFLVFLLAFSMTFGMFPSSGWAATTDGAADDTEEIETLEEATTVEEEDTGEADETDDEEEETEGVEVPLITTITDNVTNVTVEEGVDAEELKELIVQAVFLSDGDTVDVAAYSVSLETMDALTDEVLEEANATDLVTVTYEEDEETGTVSSGTIEMDVELETVKEELEESDLALTEEQIQTVLYLYSDYQSMVKNNPQYYGLQAPYLISKEDNNEDGLGILGSMLVIAGYSVDDVRSGNFTYDNLVGTIQIFAYAYSFGIEYYGDELLEVKDEVMEAVEESDAQTDAQKLLIINDWLGENVNFDMAYIMNMSSDSGDLMVAENPEENEHYEEMTASLYETYYEQYYNQYYEDAYNNGVDTDGDGNLDIPAGYEDGAAYYADQVATQAASQAAPQMVELILGAWNGNQIGVLCLRQGVCMAYTVAFGYLVQYLYPEIYGVDGATSESMESADQWKSNDDLIAYNDDGTIDVENSDYIVDYVRITYSTSVSMYGVKNDDFSTQYYWNVVKVNGNWYYIDPCYMDNFTESMERARVETNGYINHIYFMVSHTTIAELYDGYYSELDMMYDELATDTSYENNTWMYFAKSTISYDDDTYYYVYDSTDLIATEEEYSGMDSGDWNSMSSYDQDIMTSVLKGDYKLVGYEKCTKDTFEASEDNEDDDEEEPKYTTVYIDFSTSQVYNPNTGQMEDNDLIAELYAQYEEETDQYSNLGIGTSYYDGKLYFNLSNCVLTYDLSSGDVVKVKEYNTVGAVRDTSVVFGALAFKVTDDLDEADLTVTNAPVTGLTIKEDEDGNPTLYVDIATNYSFISGKTDIEDTSSYGYEFQESNYNPDYNNYLTYMSSNENYSSWSAYMSEENNDNDEFMWAANFTDTISMSEFTASESSHNFQTVSVDAYCGRDAFTEERCADCGLIKDGTREEETGTANEHHYIHFDETYYTKHDDGNWNTGDSYLCKICGHPID